MPTRVLVVDGGADNRTVFADALTYHGYQVVTARDGMDALAKLEKNEIDIITTDLRLPVLSGWEMVQMLQSDARFKDIPVIAVTASSGVADEAKAIRLGVVEFLPKPCEPKEVIDRIQRVMERKRRI